MRRRIRPVRRPSRYEPGKGELSDAGPLRGPVSRRAAGASTPRDRLLRKIRSDENTRGAHRTARPRETAPRRLSSKTMLRTRNASPPTAPVSRTPPVLSEVRRTAAVRPMIPDGPDSAPYVPVPMVSPAAGIYSSSQSEPSLRSLTRIPAAASPSRMRSEAAQSFAARALRRSSSSISTRGVM